MISTRLGRALDASDRQPLALPQRVVHETFMATDHLAVDDALYAELRQHFSEAQIVELGMTVAFFVGFGRLAATWHMVEELPEAFRTAEAIAPWGADKIEVR
jgi:alkylhydroperoxidase family enzyme